MNASDMHMSSGRRSRRASRGMLDNIGASAATNRSYSRRISTPGAHNQGVRQMAWLKNIALVLALIAAVLAVGVFVATRAFFGFVGGRMALADDSPKSYLKAASADKPYYTLYVADLDETNNCDTDLDMVVLVRQDEKGKALTCISVPTNLKVTLSDGATHQLKDAVQVGGYGELVRAVTTLADADISHFVLLNQRTIESMVDSWGGLTCNLQEEVDDPKAGVFYIPAGSQTLSGAKVTTWLRATNFTKGMEQQGINHGQFVAQLWQQIGCDGLMDAAASLDKVSYYLRTDWDAEQLLGSIQSYGGYQASSAYCAQVPCYQTGTKDDSPYSVSTTSWQAMMALANAGEDPQKANATTTASVDPGSFSITVKNGSGISGGATSIANTLVGMGFNVEQTGNADSYVYTETLVVYLDDAYKDAAQSVVNALGLGRVVDGTNHYVFDTDVLVVLGSDWMPQS